MKLLFDQNLSPHLVERLADLYPGSTHVHRIGLAQALDEDVWSYSHRHGYTIVTKDSDFADLGVLLGFPPRVVWIRRSYCSTNEAEAMLRQHYEAIDALSKDPESGVLMLF